MQLRIYGAVAITIHFHVSEDDDDGNADDIPSDLGHHAPRTNRTPSERGDEHRLRPRKRSVAAAEHYDKGGEPKRVHPRTRREARDNRLGMEAGNTRAKGKAPVKKRKFS